MARALAWHARGHRFDPDILHFSRLMVSVIFHLSFIISVAREFFDILTHKTVSKTLFFLKTE